jgi:hypothetical protein
MAKDPAVLFYTSDFLSGTFTMDYEQKGKYITLLCIQHQKGFLTEKDLRAVLEDTDVEVFDKFNLADDGLYYNIKMKECAEKRKAYSESRRNNRKAKLNNISETNDNHMSNLSKSYEKHMLNTSTSYVNHMENENETVNDNINTDVNAYTEVVYTEQMKKNIIEKFAERIDSRFKLNSFLIEIDEDWGGWDNFLDICIGDDTGVKKNFNNKLNQYKNGIFK